MKNNWKKEFLQNLGIIILLGLWAGVGYFLTKDLKLDQQGQTIYFGGNTLEMFVAWFLPGLAIIYYIYREIKLLIQLFLQGSRKMKIGCILSVIIPLALITGSIIIYTNSIAQSEINKMNSTQVVNTTETRLLDEYFTAIQENDTSKMDTLLTYPLGAHAEGNEKVLLQKYCKSPRYSGLMGDGPYEIIQVQCEGESRLRAYSLIYNDDPNIPWKINVVR
jgi:hypothetical protein